MFLSVPFGHPMPFIFNDFELTAAFIARDGRCNWLEGLQLLAVYVIFALAFYLIPR